MGAIRIELGEPTVTPRTPTRGTLVSYPIIVHGARELSFQHGSGMIRNTIGSPPLTNMVIRLEQERLPPKQGESLEITLRNKTRLSNFGVVTQT